MEDSMSTKGEATRERILTIARELFNTKGFYATTINDLVEATGLQKGSLYFHFSGKDAIVRVVLNEVIEEFLATLDRLFDGAVAGVCLDTFLTFILNMHITTGFVGGCIFGNAALEMSDTNQEFEGTMGTFFENWTGKVRAVVAKAQAQEKIRTDLDSLALAQIIIATLEGGVMMSRVLKDERPLRSCLDTLRLTLELKY
jgi:TetR/AcrR family transcriptional regulator, transcriptional repressor for nem operon